jgi:hypothetical protein
MLEKTERAIKNNQSRETGSIEHTRHRTSTNKTENTRHRRIQTKQKTQDTGRSVLFVFVLCFLFCLYSSCVLCFLFCLYSSCVLCFLFCLYSSCVLCFLFCLYSSCVVCVDKTLSTLFHNYRYALLYQWF